MNKILLSLISLTIIIGCSKNISPVDSGLETQTFHFGNGSEPQGIDPHIVTGVTEHHLLIALCEGLTTSNPRGGSSMPGAAESWEISEDGRTDTFKLQKKGTWSHGDPVTAEDFVGTWKRVLTPSLGSQYPDRRYYLEGA